MIRARPWSTIPPPPVWGPHQPEQRYFCHLLCSITGGRPPAPAIPAAHWTHAFCHPCQPIAGSSALLTVSGQQGTCWFAVLQARQHEMVEQEGSLDMARTPSLLSVECLAVYTKSSQDYLIYPPNRPVQQQKESERSSNLLKATQPISH